jgi:uncharacterized protein (TIGR03437 family)
MLKSFALLFLTAGLSCAADFLTGQSARAVMGQNTFTAQDYTDLFTEKAANTSRFGAAGGLAYAANTLFVTDANRLGLAPANNRVMIFPNIQQQFPGIDSEVPQTGRCPLCGGQASLLLGQFDSTGQPIQAISQNGMRLPTAVASDGKILAVADTGNNRILIWNSIPTTQGQPANVVLGQKDFTSVAGVSTTQSAMRGPQGVWIQGNRLFVADTQNNRVLIWNSIPTTNNQPADLVLGQPNFTTAPPVNQLDLSVAAAANTLLSPVSVSSDGTRLYVADLGFNRVLVWNSIPTANQKAADLVLGQPDFTSSISNNVQNLCDSTLINSVVDTSNTTVTWKSGSKFPSTIVGQLVVINGTRYVVSNWTSTTSVTLSTTAGTQTDVSITTYPGRCGKTLSFPRFVLSDGKKLFIADGGNDRVVVYNSIPTQNGQAADVVLGQPDEFQNLVTSFDLQNQSAANITPTPTSLAWDGTNLYVADPSDYRITIFTAGEANISTTGVVNAASRQIFAVGAIQIGGTIKEKDKITVTINGTDYPYTVDSKDTVDQISQKIATQIATSNSGAGDPKVFVYPEIGLARFILISRVPGAAGNDITYSTTLSTNPQISATVAGSNLSGGASAATMSPGTLVTISAVPGKTLTDVTASADLSADILPFELGGVQVYFDGNRAPLMYVSPTQINAQLPWEVVNSNSVSVYVRTRRSNGTVTVTDAIGIPVTSAAPGIFADPNALAPPPAVAFHASNYGTTTIAFDGSAQSGDTGVISIDGRQYKYTATGSDSLASVRDAFANLINSNPDETVVAVPSAQFTRLLIRAKAQGADGNGINVVATTSTTTSNNSGTQLTLTVTHDRTCCANTAGSPVTQANPAIPGEQILVYGTGLGLVNPTSAKVALRTGGQYRGPAANTPNSNVSALTGASTAQVLSAGAKVGTVGIYELLLELATNLTTNTQTQLTVSQGFFTSNVVTIPVLSKAASYLTITPNITSVAIGNPVDFTVTAYNSQNEVVTDYPGTVTISSTNTTATLPNVGTLTSGTGTFRVSFNAAGTFTVTARDSSTSAISGTSAVITVSDVTRLAMTTDVTNVDVGGTVTLTVTATKSDGTTNTGYTGTVHFTSSDGNAKLPSDATLTSGVGKFTIPLNTPGGQIITATDTAAPLTTGTTATIGVGPRLKLDQSATSIKVGDSVTFLATVTNNAGVTLTGFNGVIRFTSSDTSATLPPDTTVVNGTTGNVTVKFNTIGVYTVTAYDPTNGVTYATSSNITVNSQ